MLRNCLSCGLGCGHAARGDTYCTDGPRHFPIHVGYLPGATFPSIKLSVPAPYVSNTFSPSAVVGGVVIGTIFDATFATAAVAVWNNNTMTIGPAGFATVANKLGVIGGMTPSSQAAIFLGNSTTLIPELPGEVQSAVVGLSVLGLALVQSYDASFNQTYAYYLSGNETAIDFGLTALCTEAT